jgi:hypothetical protein
MKGIIIIIVCCCFIISSSAYMRRSKVDLNTLTRKTALGISDNCKQDALKRDDGVTSCKSCEEIHMSRRMMCYCWEQYLEECLTDNFGDNFMDVLDKFSVVLKSQAGKKIVG